MPFKNRWKLLNHLSPDKLASLYFQQKYGLPSMGLHRVGHDWSDLAAAATWLLVQPLDEFKFKKKLHFSKHTKMFHTYALLFSLTCFFPLFLIFPSPHFTSFFIYNNLYPFSPENVFQFKFNKKIKNRGRYFTLRKD